MMEVVDRSKAFNVDKLAEDLHELSEDDMLQFVQRTHHLHHNKQDAEDKKHKGQEQFQME